MMLFCFILFFPFVAPGDHSVLSFLNGCTFVSTQSTILALNQTRASMVFENGTEVWSADGLPGGCRSVISVSTSSVCSATNCWNSYDGVSFFNRKAPRLLWPPQINSIVVVGDVENESLISIFESRLSVNVPFRSVNLTWALDRSVDVISGFVIFGMPSDDPSRLLVWGHGEDFLQGHPLNSIVSIDISDSTFGVGGYGGGWGKPRFGGRKLWTFNGIDWCSEPQFVQDASTIVVLVKRMDDPVVRLVALHAERGSVQWTVPDSFSTTTSMVMFENKTVLVDGQVAKCFAVGSGELLWTAILPTGVGETAVISSPVADTFIVSGDQITIRLNVESGTMGRSETSFGTGVAWIRDQTPQLSMNASLLYANSSGIFVRDNVTWVNWTPPPTPPTASPTPNPTTQTASPSPPPTPSSVQPTSHSNPKQTVETTTGSHSDVAPRSVAPAKTNGQQGLSPSPSMNLLPVWVALGAVLAMALGCAAVLAVAWRRRQRKLNGYALLLDQ